MGKVVVILRGVDNHWLYAEDLSSYAQYVCVVTTGIGIVHR
jgi:hypothetical protein